MERIAIDILGPLPQSSSGNKYIMIVMDYFTKWAEAYAIPNQEAETVANKLVHEFFSRFGVVRQLHTDQGRNFESKLFQQMCVLLDIDKTRTTAFHPQSDGLVERFNRTLENMLSLYVADNQKDWDQYLQLLMMAYRATPQGSSLCSPNLMMLGREVELPIDLVFGKPPDENNLSESGYVTILRQKLETAHEYARYQLQKSANRQKKNYDHRVHCDKFAVGDFVWLLFSIRKKGLSPKLQRRWIGPFLVISVLSDCFDRIQKSPRCKAKVVHRDRLTRYLGKEAKSWLDEIDKSNEMPNRDNSPPLPESIEEPDSSGSISLQQEAVSDEADAWREAANNDDEETAGFAQGSDIEEGETDEVEVDDSSKSAVSGSSLKGRQNLSEHKEVEETGSRIGEHRRPRRSIKAPQRFGEWIE